MEEKDRGDDVEGRIGKGQGLSLSRLEGDLVGPHMLARFIEISLRQVAAGDGEAWKGLLAWRAKRPVPQATSRSACRRWSLLRRNSAMGTRHWRRIAFAVPENSTSTCMS